MNSHLVVILSEVEGRQPPESYLAKYNNYTSLQDERKHCNLMSIKPKPKTYTLNNIELLASNPVLSHCSVQVTLYLFLKVS